MTAVPPSGEEISTGSTKTYRPIVILILRSKTADKDELILGDNITYTVVVQNTGNVTLNTITLQDTLVSDLSTITPVQSEAAEEALHNNNVLDVNEKWTYQYTYTVTQDDVNAGKLQNTATVVCKDPDGNDLPPESDTYGVPSDFRPAFTVEKTANQVVAQLDDEIIYTVTIKNTGNVTLKDIDVTDTFVSDFTEAEVTKSQDEDDFLNVNEIWTYTYKHRVTQADVDNGKVRNVVTVGAKDPDNNPLQPKGKVVHVPIQQNASLSIDKSSSKPEDSTELNLGESITYTIVIKNTGNVTLKDIVVTDTLAADLATATLEKSINDDDLLDVGEIWTYVYTHEVTQADMDRGEILNTATVTGKDPLDKPVPPQHDNVDAGALRSVLLQ